MWCSDWLGNTLNYHLQKGQGQRLDYDVMAFFFTEKRGVIFMNKYHSRALITILTRSLKCGNF